MRGGVRPPARAISGLESHSRFLRLKGRAAQPQPWSSLAQLLGIRGEPHWLALTLELGLGCRWDSVWGLGFGRTKRWRLRSSRELPLRPVGAGRPPQTACEKSRHKEQVFRSFLCTRSSECADACWFCPDCSPFLCHWLASSHVKGTVRKILLNWIASNLLPPSEFRGKE